jgi:hypothetical protein
MPHNEANHHQRLFSRRVVVPDREGLRQHQHVAESRSDTAPQSASKTSPVTGISAFLGRVLNQLSLSAWLPAAMLVGSLSVLLQLHEQHNRDVARAVVNLVNRPLGLLVLLLFALVLATIVTQAFEFEVIRLLEGYWGNSLTARGISYVFVGAKQRKIIRLAKKRDDLTLRAFYKAKLFEDGIETYIVTLLENKLGGKKCDPLKGWGAKRKTEEALNFPWEESAPAHLISQIRATKDQIAEYPEQSRVLPTKLGNVIRATEDSLESVKDGELEQFVILHWDETPDVLRKEHDQYRTRLDLYCMLVFVFFVLAIVSPLLLTHGPRYIVGAAITSAAYLLMSFVSYAAAIASARGYGSALKAIDEIVSTKEAESEKPRNGNGARLGRRRAASTTRN